MIDSTASSGLLLARISGVPVYVRGDFLALLLFIFSALQHRYGEELQFLVGSTVLFSATSSLLIAVVLVLYEFAHILTGRRYGNDCRAIQLNYLGAIATFSRDSKTAREELLVASAGPLLNIGIALVCAGAHECSGEMLRAARSLTWLEFTGLMYALTGIFAIANWAVALFNLLPFFPMDGGRILRSALWFLTGRRRTATVIAACFTTTGIALFGFFSFPEFCRYNAAAGLRWAGFGVLLSLLISRTVRDEGTKAEHDNLIPETSRLAGAAAGS